LIVNAAGSLIRQAALVGGLLALGAIGARAQTLTVSGSPALMRVNTAVAGLPPTSVTSGATTYNIAAKKKTTPLKVTGRLSAAMPPGVTLTVTLTAPTGATSNGAVTLDATTRDLVGNITNTAVEIESITYTLSATAAAGVVTAQSRTVTFTLVAWP
jgi:hypothetical protein